MGVVVRPDMTPRDICMAPLSDFCCIYAGECRTAPTHALSSPQAADRLSVESSSVSGRWWSREPQISD